MGPVLTEFFFTNWQLNHYSFRANIFYRKQAGYHRQRTFDNFDEFGFSEKFEEFCYQTGFEQIKIDTENMLEGLDNLTHFYSYYT